MITTDLSVVRGIAIVKWDLKTISPLCIKSGTSSTEKNRTGEDITTSDFHFSVALKEGKPGTKYNVPASSVKGALRGFTIKRLVDRAYWDAMILSKKEDCDEVTNHAVGPSKNDEAMSVDTPKPALTDALKDPGWRLVQNLFGLALDDEDKKKANETVAGRLSILSETEIKNFEKVPRSPMDRVTSAAKKGGLHNMQELKNERRSTSSFASSIPLPKT